MDITTIVTQRFGEFVADTGVRAGEFITRVGTEAGEFLSSGAGAATGSVGATGIIFLVLAWIFWFVVGVGGFIFWVVMAIDCAHRDFKERGHKTIWILVLLLSIVGVLLELHLISAFIYYLAVKRKSRARVEVIALPRAPKARVKAKTRPRVKKKARKARRGRKR